MATKIDLNVFERNAKRKNKRGLLRGYYNIFDHPEEFQVVKKAGVRDRILLEVTIDVSCVDALIDYFRKEGFTTYGDDFYFQEITYKDLKTDPKYKGTMSPKAEEELWKELLSRKTNEKKYKLLENDDAIFYLLPYKDDIESLYDFIKAYKKAIIKFAKKDDVTIIMKPIGYSDQISGFISFNFYDLDEKEDGKEVEVEYASGINIATNFDEPVTIFATSMYLRAVGKTKEELDEMKVSLFGDNYK